MVAGLWAHGAREFADQAYLFLRLPQAGLIPTVEGYLEIVARMAEMNHDLTATWIQAASARFRTVGEQVPHRPEAHVSR